jgi:hypothetical protein
MLAQVLQTFLAKKNLVKSLLISTLDKVIYYIHWNIFTGLNKTPLHYTKSGGDQLKKTSRFIQHARSISRFLWTAPSAYVGFEWFELGGKFWDILSMTTLYSIPLQGPRLVNLQLPRQRCIVLYNKRKYFCF